MCLLTIEAILHPLHPASSEEIISELTNHGHPITRKLDDGTMRRKEQAARELADHYITIHNRIEPIFINSQQ